VLRYIACMCVTDASLVDVLSILQHVAVCCGISHVCVAAHLARHPSATPLSRPQTICVYKYHHELDMEKTLTCTHLHTRRHNRFFGGKMGGNTKNIIEHRCSIIFAWRWKRGGPQEDDSAYDGAWMLHHTCSAVKKRASCTPATYVYVHV